MSATANYFTLLDLPITFELDPVKLSLQYREAVKAVHPDRFAASSEQEQRVAVQRAAELNHAYETLRSATSRALYLLSLQASINEETTVQDSEFLLQQMQWREELEELEQEQNLAAISSFKTRLRKAREDIEQDFSRFWQDSAHRTQAERLARRMQFLDKVLYETRQIEERLDD